MIHQHHKLQYILFNTGLSTEEQVASMAPMQQYQYFAALFKTLF
jgi:hypothetical protein